MKVLQALFVDMLTWRTVKVCDWPEVVAKILSVQRQAHAFVRATLNFGFRMRLVTLPICTLISVSEGFLSKFSRWPLRTSIPSSIGLYRDRATVTSSSSLLISSDTDNAKWCVPETRDGSKLAETSLVLAHDWGLVITEHKGVAIVLRVSQPSKVQY